MATKQENSYMQCDSHQNFTVMGIKGCIIIQYYKSNLCFLKCAGSFPFLLSEARKFVD